MEAQDANYRMVDGDGDSCDGFAYSIEIGEVGQPVVVLMFHGMKVTYSGWFRDEILEKLQELLAEFEPYALKLDLAEGNHE